MFRMMVVCVAGMSVGLLASGRMPPASPKAPMEQPAEVPTQGDRNQAKQSTGDALAATQPKPIRIYTIVERSTNYKGDPIETPSKAAQKLWPYYGVGHDGMGWMGAAIRIGQDSIDPDDDGILNEDVFRKAIAAAVPDRLNYRGLFEADWEGKWSDNLQRGPGSATHKQALAQGRKCVQIMNEMLPKGLPYIYGCPTIRMIWTGRPGDVGGERWEVDPKFMENVKTWGAFLDDQRVLAPSLYVNDSAKTLPFPNIAAQQITYAREIVATCKKLWPHKPVMGYFSARYTGGNPRHFEIVDPIEQMACARAAAEAGLDGAVIWSADGHLTKRVASDPKYPYPNTEAKDRQLVQRVRGMLAKDGGDPVEYCDRVHLELLRQLRQAFAEAGR